MSWVKDAIDTVVELGKFIIGDKKPVVLEEPLDELKVEKSAQKIADRRRERAARKNSGEK
jgi:hypothetical protein